jgi:hypothetical protein
VIDTLRVLVDWRCNLHCSYCCNEQPAIRSQIKPTRLDDIDFSAYRVVCITGGEPLLRPDLVYAVCQRIPRGVLRVLYSNGILLTPPMARQLWGFGINSINVGLHIESTFSVLIQRATASGWRGGIRFHAQDCHRWLADLYPDLEFRFWKMDDCDRPNEDRVVLLPAFSPLQTL